MDHNVFALDRYVNTMNQDANLGIIGSVTQADLSILRSSGRLGEFAVVYRTERIHRGGGYGNQGRHPLAWAIAVYVDDQLFRIFNARGSGREWNNIDKLAAWLRDQGFWYWWTRNDLEPVGTAVLEPDDVSELPIPLDPLFHQLDAGG
ncbi:MAG: hypothetical protein ACI845_003143 [Gammaproteobacteria bacterium]|jgi:hypothetical protein